MIDDVVLKGWLEDKRWLAWLASWLAGWLAGTLATDFKCVHKLIVFSNIHIHTVIPS